MDQPLNTDDKDLEFELVGDPDRDYDELGNPIGVTTEYDEHGNPTPAQIQRWKDLDAATAAYWRRHAEETTAIARRGDAEMIAAGLVPRRSIPRDELLAAGALNIRGKRRKPAPKNPQGQLDLFAGLSEDDAAAES